MSLDAGQVIEHAVRRDHMGISELSRKLHVSRRTIYNWFKQKTLSFDVIYKIGNVIHHDFSKEFPDEFARFVAENRNNNPVATGLDGVQISSVNYWMNKYIRLLEKYNDLLSHEFSTSPDNEEEEKLVAATEQI